MEGEGWGSLWGSFQIVWAFAKQDKLQCPQGVPSLSLLAAGEVIEIDETDPSNQIPNASSLLEFPTKGRRFT